MYGELEIMVLGGSDRVGAYRLIKGGRGVIGGRLVVNVHVRWI